MQISHLSLLVSQFKIYFLIDVATLFILLISLFSITPLNRSFGKSDKNSNI